MEYKKIITQWKEFKIPETLPRQISIELNHNFITTITGPRRAGKTYLCFQLIHELLKKGISRENILYINFEDEKLLGAEAKDMDMLLDSFYELSDINEKQKIYLFLDEIQNVKDWDVWIRKIHNLHNEIKITLTGSSSKLLSKEISTKLRGRVLNTEVFPLSFKEYLEWKAIDYNEKTVSYSKERFAIKKAFSSYLINGGYPALITNNIPYEQILQSYFQSMIFKDVIERYNVKEIKKLKMLASLLFESVAKEISYNKLANKLNSLGYNVSKNTIIEYVSYFEDAYLFFQNLRYEYSLIKQLGSIKKVYCIDNGLLNAVSFKFSEDLGRLVENLVFIELKRRNEEILYHRKYYECDFIIKEKNKVVNAIQVTKKLTDESYNREIKGLLEALKIYKLKEGILLIYEGEEDKREIDGKTIMIIPVWRWLLNQK